MLKQRILTALILAPLVVWGILALPNTAFAAIYGAIILMGAWEWAQLLGWHDAGRRTAHVAVHALLLLALHAYASAAVVSLILMAAGAWWLVALVLVILYPTGSGLWRQSAPARFVAGLLVLQPAWLALVTLHQTPGPVFVLLLMLLIWGADSGAYFAGRALGRHKLAPRVSPGKSWEGVLGGALSALVIAAVFYHWQAPQLGLAGFLAAVLATIAISIVGDLLESMFKRIVDVKDSGGLLPGHGGVLDRIDSLTAAAPVFVILLGWLSR